MSKEELSSYALVVAMSLLAAGLIVIYIVSPVAEYFAQKRGQDPHAAEDYCLAWGIHLVVLSACVLFAIPKK